MTVAQIGRRTKVTRHRGTTRSGQFMPKEVGEPGQAKCGHRAAAAMELAKLSRVHWANHDRPRSGLLLVELTP